MNIGNVTEFTGAVQNAKFREMALNLTVSFTCGMLNFMFWMVEWFSEYIYFCFMHVCQPASHFTCSHISHIITNDIVIFNSMHIMAIVVIDMRNVFITNRTVDCASENKCLTWNRKKNNNMEKEEIKCSEHKLHFYMSFFIARSDSHFYGWFIPNNYMMMNEKSILTSSVITRMDARWFVCAQHPFSWAIREWSNSDMLFPSSASVEWKKGNLTGWILLLVIHCIGCYSYAFKSYMCYNS